MSTAHLAELLLEMMLARAGSNELPPHIANHPYGLHGRATDLAVQYVEAAELVGVPLPDLVALGQDESAHDPDVVSRVGALGLMQLMPTGPWFRSWVDETDRFMGLGVDASERLNIIWGAYALRDALRVCNGSLAHAYGYYRTGHTCLAGPKSEKTAELAEWLRRRLAEGDPS